VSAKTARSRGRNHGVERRGNEVGLLDAALAYDGTKPWADLIAEADLPVTTIDSPFVEITCLPSLIDMTDVKGGFVRGPQLL